jgi:NAD(P)-dependent dehydrogenase (short-subunit alcohol dehydrogenase family)
MCRRLLGRVAIVTGGSGYIGKSIVEEFVKEGCNVVFTYFKNKANADLLLLKMKKYKRKIFSIKCDVRKIEDVGNVVNTTITKFKKLTFWLIMLV